MQNRALSRAPVIVVLAKGADTILNDVIQLDETGVTGAIVSSCSS